jgi:lipooligosaccharide transport system permease protein
MSTNYAEAGTVRAPGRGLVFPNPFTLGTYRVFQRNKDVFLKLWKTELWPPVVETLLSLFAFGFGLGVYIAQVNGQPYIQFIAAGLIFSSVLFTASFECMFGTFIRMQQEKVFDAIIATPVSIEEVVSGEIFFAAVRATFNGTCVVVVMAVLQLIPSWWVILVPPVALLTGFLLASLAVIVTSLVSSFTSFNYYITLGVIPMQLFSSIFFPSSQLPENVRWVAFFSPLYPAVELGRALYTGHIHAGLLLYLGWIVALTVVLYLVAVNLMRRRLIK